MGNKLAKKKVDYSYSDYNHQGNTLTLMEETIETTRLEYRDNGYGEVGLVVVSIIKIKKNEKK